MPPRPSIHHHHYHTTIKTYINGPLTLLHLPPPLSNTPAKYLTLHISAYTARSDLPASLRLHVVIPRQTRSVAEMARCIDAAWAHKDLIDWERMIAARGVSVRGRSVKTDEDVVEWMERWGAEEEEGWLCG